VFPSRAVPRVVGAQGNTNYRLPSRLKNKPNQSENLIKVGNPATAIPSAMVHGEAPFNGSVSTTQIVRQFGEDIHDHKYKKLLPKYLQKRVTH